MCEKQIYEMFLLVLEQRMRIERPFALEVQYLYRYHKFRHFAKKLSKQQSKASELTANSFCQIRWRERKITK
jgi:hypothetical protein